MDRRELAFLCSILAGDHTQFFPKSLWRIVLNAIADPNLFPDGRSIVLSQRRAHRGINVLLEDPTTVLPVSWKEIDFRSIESGGELLLVPTLGLECVLYKPPRELPLFDLSHFPSAAVTPPGEPPADDPMDLGILYRSRSPTPDPFANFSSQDPSDPPFTQGL